MVGAGSSRPSKNTSSRWQAGKVQPPPGDATPSATPLGHSVSTSVSSPGRSQSVLPEATSISIGVTSDPPPKCCPRIVVPKGAAGCRDATGTVTSDTIAPLGAKTVSRFLKIVPIVPPGPRTSFGALGNSPGPSPLRPNIPTTDPSRPTHSTRISYEFVTHTTLSSTNVPSLRLLNGTGAEATGSRNIVGFSSGAESQPAVAATKTMAATLASCPPDTGLTLLPGGASTRPSTDRWST